MQRNSKVLGGAVGLIAIAVLVVGFVIVRPVLAQEESTTTDQVDSTQSVDTVSSSTDTSVSSTDTATPTAQDGSTSVATDTPPPPPPPPPVVTEAPPPPPPPPATETVTSTNGQVEVQLKCSMSYTAPLYDTPSGHLDAGYFLGTDEASTTGMTVAHLIGEQAWTVCRDARGYEHEFKITGQEYAALAVRGTPQKSVMESPEDAALDSFADTPTPASDAPASTNTSTETQPTVSPEVAPTSSDTSSTTSETTPSASTTDSSSSTSDSVQPGSADSSSTPSN